MQRSQNDEHQEQKMKIVFCYRIKNVARYSKENFAHFHQQLEQQLSQNHLL